MLNEESVGLQPSLALKFLIDGRRSDNLLAAVSVKPVDGLWDFFGETMKNRLEPFDQTENGPDWIEVQTVQKKLLEGSPRPFATGVSHPARKLADGTTFKKKHVVTPYQLEFKAVPAVQNLNDEQNPLEWYKPLMNNIEAGDDLFEVWAWNGQTTRHRRKGEYYKLAWRTATSLLPKFVSVTSFNEWHEGTQIETAIPKITKDNDNVNYNYLSYEPDPPDAYLTLTRSLISDFLQSKSVNETI